MKCHHRGFGIKKRSWFSRRSRLFGYRPSFMEPLPQGGPQGVPPSHDGGAGVRRRSYFQDNAEYIGYLTDDESGSGDEGNHNGLNLICRRRRELLGNDMSFSNCLTLFMTIGGLLLLFIFAVSPWGVPPPRRL